jgi:hypothetical protein
VAGPLTPILDDFDRPDGDLGANWEVWDGEGGIVDGALVSVNGEGMGASWLADTFGPDIEIYCDIVHVGAGFSLQFTHDDVTGYIVEVRDGFSKISRLDGDEDVGGAQVLLGASIDVVFADGDACLLRRRGDQIELWKRHGGTWTLVATRTDDTYTAAGYVLSVVLNDDSSETVDNFGGGTLLVPSPIARLILSQGNV